MVLETGLVIRPRSVVQNREWQVVIAQQGKGIFYDSHFIKFVYSEKATKFCEISTLLLCTVHTDKSKVEVLQNFVAFSEYTNFK